MGCSPNCPAEPPPFDPGSEKESTQLSPVSECAAGGQTTRQQRRELLTVVWSVVPPGLGNPLPRLKPPEAVHRSARRPHSRPPIPASQAAAPLPKGERNSAFVHAGAQNR